MKEAIIFDTEYTAWEGSMQRDWSGPDEHREIVQIAALRIDIENFKAVDDPLDIIVKPRINGKLSDYFIKLTGITNEEMENRGVDFLYAANKFAEYSNGAKIYSYGNDSAILNENIKLYELKNELKEFHGGDIRAWAQAYSFDTTNITSGMFAEYAGAPFKTQPHYALNDVLSLQAGIKFLVEEKGFGNPFMD